MILSKELVEGRPLRAIFNFTMPLLLGNLLQQIYSLVDAIIVGRYLGIGALASVGASNSVTFFILGFCFGCCAGFGIPIAQKFGARDYSTMRRYVNVGRTLVAVVSVVVTAVTCIYCADILRMMQTPDNIFDGAWDYLFVTFVGIPFTFFYNYLACVIRALGDSRTPFWFLLLSTALNVALDFVFIVGLDGGVMGAAVATVTAQAVAAALCYVYMKRKFDILRSSAEERRFSPTLARTLLAIGVPMGLQFSITAIGSIMLQSANNALGTACVAAFTAATRIKVFFMCPFDALGMAMATFAGQNYGAGRPRRVWQGVKASVLLMMIYWAILFAVLTPLGRDFATLFVDAAETQIVDLTEFCTRIALIFFPALGLLNILRNVIQGVGFTNFAMFSGVSELLARGAVSLWAVPAWSFAAVSYGDPMAWVAACIFLIPAFAWVYRRIKIN